MLVVDASVAVAAAFGVDGFGVLGDEPLVAPPVMWSEARSSLHELVWRRELTRKTAEETVDRLDRSPIEERRHRSLGATAWQIADELGWAKTYDAEYVALARLLDCRVVTLDARLRRGAGRLGLVVGPDEL